MSAVLFWIERADSGDIRIAMKEMLKALFLYKVKLSL
jgi:hypothetical protein